MQYFFLLQFNTYTLIWHIVNLYVLSIDDYHIRGRPSGRGVPAFTKILLK
jgi:hypothetical protein